MHEWPRPHEGVDQQPVPAFSEQVAASTEAFREAYDSRLFLTMQRLDAVLAERLSDYYDPQRKRKTPQGIEPSRSHLTDLHVFQFKEEEGGVVHNRLLFVGPAPLGQGISDQSVSITKYHASAENPGQSEAIIGQAIFVYTPHELAGVQEWSDLEHTSTLIYYLRSRTYQGREDLLLEEPDVYGYIGGAKPAADANILLQKGVTIKGRTRFVHTENRKNDAQIDPVVIVEDMISILERKDTLYMESRSMDFEQDKEHQIHPDVKPEEIERVIAHFQD